MRSPETERFNNIMTGLYSDNNALNTLHQSNLITRRDETLKDLVLKSTDAEVTRFLTQDSNGFFGSFPYLAGINQALVNAQTVQTSALYAHICLNLHKLKPATLQLIHASTNADTLFAALTNADAKQHLGDFSTNDARIKTLLPHIINNIKLQAANATLVNNTTTVQAIENALRTNRDLDPTSKSTLALRHFKLKAQEISFDAVTEHDFNNPLRMGTYEFRDSLLQTDNASAITHITQHLLALYTEKFAHLKIDAIKELINKTDTAEFKTHLSAFMNDTYHRNRQEDLNKVQFGDSINTNAEVLALKQAMMRGFIQAKIQHGTDAEIQTLKNSTQNLSTLKNALNSMGITQTEFMTEEFCDYTKKALENLDKQKNVTKLTTLLNSNDSAYKSANAHKALLAVFNSLSSKEQAKALAKFDADPLILPRLLQAETPEAIQYFLEAENVAIEAPLLQALVVENQKLKALMPIKNHALARIFAEFNGDLILSADQATALNALINNPFYYNNGTWSQGFTNEFNRILGNFPGEIRNKLHDAIVNPFVGHTAEIMAQKNHNAALVNRAPDHLQDSLVNYLMSLHKTTVLTANQFQAIKFAFINAKTLAEFKKSLSAVAEYNKLPDINRPAFEQPENTLFKDMTEGEFQTLKNQRRSACLSDNAAYATVLTEESLKMRELGTKLDALKAQYASFDFKDIAGDVDTVLNPAFVKKATIVALKDGYKTLADFAANQVLFLEKKKNDLKQYQDELKAELARGPGSNKREAIRLKLDDINLLLPRIDAELTNIKPLHVALSKPENPDESIIARIERQDTDTQSRYLTLKKTYGYQHSTQAMTGNAANYTTPSSLVGSYNIANENRIDIHHVNLPEQERMYKNEQPIQSGQFYVHTVDCGPNKVAQITEEIVPNKISYRIPKAFTAANRDEQFKQAHQMVLIHLARFAAEPNKEGFKITVGPHSDNQFIADMMVLYQKLGPAVGFKMSRVNFVGYNPTKDTSWGRYDGCAKIAQETLDAFIEDGNKNLLLTDSKAALKQITQDNKEAPKQSEQLSDRFKKMNADIRNIDQKEILEEKNANYSSPRPR